MPTNPPSSPSSAEDPDLLDSLLAASHKGDISRLIRIHGYPALAQLWPQLPPVQRAALELCRNFDATIVHELDDTP